MRVQLLPSVLGDGDSGCQYLTTYLINETVAIDAGALGFYRTPVEQARVRSVFISHSHLDHIGSLPMFIDNVYNPTRDPPTVYAGPEVLDCIGRHLLNHEMWVDYDELARRLPPFWKRAELEGCRAVEVDGLRITPVPVNHVVPTFGFLIEDDHSALVIPSDTGPTEEIWQRANRLAHLRAVFLEASFPDEFSHVANDAMHLTPALFAREVGKLTGQPRILAVHLKAQFLDVVKGEVQALGLNHVEIVEAGRTYDF